MKVINYGVSGFAALALAQLAPDALAQTAPVVVAQADGTQSTLDAVIVTGTRQQGLKAVDSPTPIQIIDAGTLKRTGQIDVLQALWQTGAQSLPSLDPEAARQTLEAMPWIESASVAKIYPDRVAIKLAERKPFALWQKGRELFVVDRAGREIVPYAPTWDPTAIDCSGSKTA